MDILLVSFLNGISLAFILFLLGTGLSLTMGLMRIVNLAHGALYMFGAYVGIAVAKFTGDYVGSNFSFLLGALAGGICAGLIGLMMEKGCFRRLFQEPDNQVLLSIGFIYMLTNIVRWIWGPVARMGFVPSALSGSITMGELTFPVYRLALIGIGIVMAIGLWLFQDKTRVGAIIRAGMDNREITSGLGINLNLIFTGVFALGAFVAGFCGIIGGSILGVSLSVGWDVLFLSVFVVMVGGAGSIQGALVAAIIIGLVDAFGKAFFPAIAYYSMYLVLIFVLMFRPAGLMGREI